MTRARDLADSADKDIAGTLTLDGLVVDDITIDGSTISDGGDFTLDVGGDITLDADGADIRLKDGGTEFAILHNSGYFGVYSTISDADLKIQGNDGGSLIDALTFDMSQAGRAIFNEGVVCKSSTGGDFGVNINTASGDSMKLQVVDTGSAGAANGVISVSDGDLILSPSANVGIGLTAPSYTLELFKATGNLVRFSTSDDNNGATNPLSVDYNTALRIDNAYSGAAPSASGTKVAKIQLSTVTTDGYGAYGAIVVHGIGSGYDSGEMAFAVGSNSSGLMTERFRIGSAGQLGIGGATYGTAGQVLTSGGSGTAPTWATVASSGPLFDDFLFR